MSYKLSDTIDTEYFKDMLPIYSRRITRNHRPIFHIKYTWETCKNIVKGRRVRHERSYRRHAIKEDDAR